MSVTYPIPPGGTPIPGKDFRLGEASTGDDYPRMRGLCSCGCGLLASMRHPGLKSEQPQPDVLPIDQPQEQAA